MFLVIGGLGKVMELPEFRDPIKSLQSPLRCFGIQKNPQPGEPPRLSRVLVEVAVAGFGYKFFFI